jgi:hypothetical protein
MKFHRRFGKEVYRGYKGSNTKEHAQEEAKYARREGYKARVVKATKESGWKYAVVVKNKHPEW